VDTFAGLIFAAWDPVAPSLDEWLGPFKWYLSLMFDRTEAGLESVGPPQRFVIKANWKCAGEQFNADGYHTLTLHRSLLELGVIGSGMTGDAVAEEMAPAMYGVDVGAPQGHGLRCIPAETTFRMLMGKSAEGLSTMEKLRRLPPPGLTAAMVEELPKRFSDAEMRVLSSCSPQVGGLFPNSGYLVIPSPQPDGTMSANISWHTFVPRATGEFEYINWTFVERDAPQEVKDAMARASIRSLGTSGTVEQDDAEAWPSMQRCATGAMGRRQTLKYQAILGENKPPDWPGGGYVYDGFTKDDSQWHWWLRWLSFMTGQA
jgi:hypothetical protein